MASVSPKQQPNTTTTTITSNNNNNINSSDFSVLMNTLLSNLAFLKDRVEHSSQTTAALLDKASVLKGQIKRKYAADDYGNIPSDKPKSNTLPRNYELSTSLIYDDRCTEKKDNAVVTSTPTAADGDKGSSSNRDAVDEECTRLRGREQELLQVIGRLDVENQTMSDAVEEFHASIDLIMEKYRNEVKQLAIQKETSKQYEAMYQREKDENDVLRNENVILKQKIDQMVQVMHMAVQQDNDVSKDEESVNEQLALENETLRQLLQISDISTLTV